MATAGTPARTFTTNDKVATRNPHFLSCEKAGAITTTTTTNDYLAPFAGRVEDIADCCLRVETTSTGEVEMDFTVNDVSVFTTKPKILAAAPDPAHTQQTTGIQAGVLDALANRDFAKNDKLSVIITGTITGASDATAYVGITQDADYDQDVTIAVS